LDVALRRHISPSMTFVLRNIAASLAVLAIALTAGVAGAARGQAAVAGEIVICAGQGAATVYLDADGNPTGPPHWCPDCVLSLFAAVASTALLPAPSDTCLGAAYPVSASRHIPAPAPVPQARGPPFPA